jgi:hypothetical protein
MRLPRPGSFRRLAVLAAVLVVWSVPPSAMTGGASRTSTALPQPPELQAFHRDGQTSITWMEVGELFQEDLPAPTSAISFDTHFEIDLWLHQQAPRETATTDATLRNVQALTVRPGQAITWKIQGGRSVIQQGSGVADPLGLVTVPGVALKRAAKRRLVVDLAASEGPARPASLPEGTPAGTGTSPSSRPPSPAVETPSQTGGEGRRVASMPQPGAACPRLPPPRQTDRIVRVGPKRADELPAIVAGAESGTTILLDDGTYQIGDRSLLFRRERVTLRSASGNRDAVILDGDRYRTGIMVAIQASHVTVADLTIRRVFYHPVHVSGGGHHALLYNLRIVDGRQHLIKVNPSAAGAMNDHGTLACSLLELTSAGRAYVEAHPTPGFRCYTGGLNGHQAWGWVVRDNVFRDIYCSDGVALGAVHFWKTSRDIVVERNTIQNCARGIGFGLGPDGPDRQYPDTPFREIPGRVGHLGGIIRNNVIWSGIGRLFDSGIGLEQAHGVKVYHNTVYAGDGFSSIDTRFPNSNPLIKNNLVSLPMTVRDGGRPSMEGNVDSASADMFVDAATGDLRLRATATQAIDRGVDVPGDVPDDVSGHARDAMPDLGAHEYVAGTGRALSSASSPRRP